MGTKKNKKNPYQIPNPEEQNIFKKYSFGDKNEPLDFYSHKPIFAFDYLSLEKSNLCFNNSSLSTDDFIGLFDFLKQVSSISYQELINGKNVYKFHEVDPDDKNVSISKNDFIKKLNNGRMGSSIEELPTIYQLKVYCLEQSARIAGFIYKRVFHLVWFDIDHRIYSKK